MSLPELGKGGELPIGVHQATLAELLSRFGTGSVQRVQVAARLKRIVDLASRTGSLDRVIVFGSFVTGKPEPRDVDVVLVMRDDFELTNCPPDVMPLFDHARADQQFGASIFWIRPGMLFLESLDQFIVSWQRNRGGGRRGIVEVLS